MVTRIDIRYLRPATMGQMLRIETRLGRLDARSAQIEQKIFNKESGKILTEADVTIAVLHPSSPRALALEGEIARQLRLTDVESN